MRINRLETSTPANSAARPIPDMREIVSAATRTDGRSRDDRLKDLERHAAHEFTLQTQGQLARLNAAITDRAREIDRLDLSIAELDRLANGTNRLRPARGDAVPWTGPDRVQVVAYSVLSIAMLAAAWNLTTTTLLNTGLFRTRFEAGTLALTPLLGAIVFKCGCMFVRTDSGKRNYLRGLFAASVLFWAAWIILYASAFGHGVAESVDDVIAQFRAGPGADSGNGESQSSIDVGQAFIAVSFLAEAFIAALVWLVIEQIVATHAGATSVLNPERISLERTAVEARAQREVLAQEQRDDLAERSMLESRLALHADATQSEFRRFESIAPELVRAIAIGGESFTRPSHPTTLNGAHS